MTNDEYENALKEIDKQQHEKSAKAALSLCAENPTLEAAPRSMIAYYCELLQCDKRRAK